MTFAQLTYRESLRDIETCLGAVGGKLYHLGFRTSVARSTLADANESRDWRIYADFAQTLIATARRLYARDPMGVELDQSLYALDSTTIDLCLMLFSWARFRRRKAGIKMHTLLDLRGNIPSVRAHHRRQGARRKRAGSDRGGGGRVLRDGSRCQCTCWAIVRKRLGLESNLYQLLQILSLTLFEKAPFLCALQASDDDANLAENVRQLILFEF
jgi:hypothetical protein